MGIGCIRIKRLVRESYDEKFVVAGIHHRVGRARTHQDHCYARLRKVLSSTGGSLTVIPTQTPRAERPDDEKLRLEQMEVIASLGSMSDCRGMNVLNRESCRSERGGEREALAVLIPRLDDVQNLDKR